MRPIELDPALVLLPKEDLAALLVALHDVDQTADTRPQGQISVSDRPYQWQIGVSEGDPAVQVLRVSAAHELSAIPILSPTNPQP